MKQLPCRYFFAIKSGISKNSASRVAVLGLVTLLYGFGSPRLTHAVDKVRISYSGPSISNALLWVAQESKRFEKNNLDAEVIYLAGSLGQAALIAGEVQLAVYTGLLLTPARLQGADVTMVASFLDHLLSRLVVRQEIRSVSDLRGKKLGVTRYGTASDFGMRLMITKLGLDPDKDVSILQIGDNPTRVAALQNRIIDGAIFDPPDYKKAVAVGGRVLFNLEESRDPYQHAGLVTLRKNIANRSDIIRRSVKAIVEAAAVVRNDPVVSKRALKQRLRLGDTKELDDAYQLLRGFTRAKPYPSVDGFRAILGDLTKRLPAAKNADAKDFIDARFIEEFDKAGFIDSLSQ